MQTASEIKELKDHIRWLEDERIDAGAVEERLDGIDEDLKRLAGRFNEIAAAINQNTETLNKLIDGFNRHGEGLKQLVEVLAAPKPQPAMGDVFDAVFKQTPKKPAAKPKPRKPRFTVVSKDGDGSPGAAS